MVHSYVRIGRVVVNSWSHQFGRFRRLLVSSNGGLHFVDNTFAEVIDDLPHREHIVSWSHDSGHPGHLLVFGGIVSALPPTGFTNRLAGNAVLIREYAGGARWHGLSVRRAAVKPHCSVLVRMSNEEDVLVGSVTLS